MSDLMPPSPVVERGIALHKVNDCSIAPYCDSWNAYWLCYYFLCVFTIYSARNTVLSIHLLTLGESLQMIHFITMALGGEGYLNFMGNEVCYYL